MTTNDQDSGKKKADLPPPSSRQEPDFSLRSLLPWVLPAVILGLFAVVMMLIKR